MAYSYKIKCHYDNKKHDTSINKKYEVSCFLECMYNIKNIYPLIKSGSDINKLFNHLNHFRLKAYCQSIHQPSFQDMICLIQDIV